MAISDLFPTKASAVIFISYMALFINQGLLVTASKRKDGSFAYNATTVVLMTEVVKLGMAIFLHLREATVKETISTIRQNLQVFALYFVPAALYTIYNNLVFVNLKHYDPTTYFILLQLRVVATGIIFQVLFGKQLTRIQWSSLVLLMIGCAVKNVRFWSPAVGPTTAALSNNTSASHNPVVPRLDLHLLYLLFQVFASCFAGVYNEYLIKSNGSISVPLMLQNVFMYVDSIVANIVALALTQSLGDAVSSHNVHALLDWNVIAIILNNASVGIVTSLFLRSLNSILKTFASGLELVFTAILAWIFFGIRVGVSTWLAIFIVSSAIYLYSHSPVNNPAPKESNIQHAKDEI
eukprot:scpid88776/ scgid31310/ CMP-sialic acid transporter 4